MRFPPGSTSMEKEEMEIHEPPTSPRMRVRPVRWTVSGVAVAALAIGGAVVAAPSALAEAPSLTQAASSLRPVEYLARGLVAAQVPGGIFLSWRFLGDEPDGLSWNVYRKDGDADWVQVTTIAPRDVQPESNYPTNPGVVKEDVTP